MSNFILISLHDRLHPIVDGILGCRPRHEGVSVCIFSGKIVSKGGSYWYEYSTTASDCAKGDAQGLASLLTNQLAQFRRTCQMQQNDVANIFLLDNPRTTEEQTLSETWIEAFDTLYAQGNRNFRLIRVLFAYDIDDPASVSACTDGDILSSIIEQYETKATDTKNATYPNLLFYLTNLDSSEAAICKNKEDHDLMMTRFLADFMMLASNANDSYGVFASTTAQPPTNCFSAGYAEYMYYYPDVERYFALASERDLYHKCLNDADETRGKEAEEATDIEDEKAMDIDAHPIGLLARASRLSERYKNVPYDNDISQYPQTADKEIDEHIASLKKVIEAEYQRELDAYHRAYSVKMEKVEQKQKAYESATIQENETPDDFDTRKTQLKAEWEESQRELRGMTFHPNCPGYVDRQTIYLQHLLSPTEGKKEEAKYEQLITYVLSQDFLRFAQTYKPPKEEDDDVTEEVEDNLEDRRGCLSWLFFWEKNDEEDMLEEDTDEPPVPEEPEHPHAKEHIMGIARLKKLKGKFEDYEAQVKNIQQKEEARSKDCKNFELTRHSKSIPLIDLDKLEAEHDGQSDGLLTSSMEQWSKEEKRTLTSLVAIVAQESSEYTKGHYTWLNWAKPFSLVKSSDAELLAACNQLQRMSAPFVNYNTDSAQAERDFITILYSGDKDFGSKVQAMREGGNLENAACIRAQTSTHIESKVAIMNYLPLSQTILKAITQAMHPALPSTLPAIDSPTDELSADEADDSVIEDWGGH